MPESKSGALQPYARTVVKGLFEFASHQNEIEWSPFSDGVDIHRLYGDGISGPTAALLRFRKAGMVPVHEHQGYEHIIVLEGSQKDHNGVSERGMLVVSPPGTQHGIVSEAGCIVLAIYEKPVKFLIPDLTQNEGSDG